MYKCDKAKVSKKQLEAGAVNGFFANFG